MARGYLYYVSFAGVTGASERLDSSAAGARLRDLRARSSVPVVAGFGIKDAASAASMATEADGVVDGVAGPPPAASQRHDGDPERARVDAEDCPRLLR